MGEIAHLRLSDTDYPDCLRTIPSPPKDLYYIGNFIELCQLPRLTVVGSRRVTPYGQAVTTSLVRAAAEQGIVIISGLALGVDGIAHTAALDANGATIAILPCGLDHIYPASHTQLAQRILRSGGAIVSEYPAGTPPLKQHFVARNRIVSGLGNGILITEAASKSGTLHTANFALEQGKTVMAVPGNITSQLSAGTNGLIKTGAVPVTDVDDILLALGLQRTDRKTDIVAANAEEALLLRLLRGGMSDESELLARSKLPIVMFNQTLTMLEITGKIRPLGSGHWTLM